MKTSANEKTVERPWEFACVLPTQLTSPSGRGRSPEVRLAAAVLEDAFYCVTRNDGARSRTQRQDFIEARNWFFDTSRQGPFAFENVCDVLALDADAVRQRLRRVVAWNAPATSTARTKSTRVGSAL